jgi:trk system potassium uptake protein TrkH
MNFKAVNYVLGKIFMIVGILIALPIAVAFYYDEQQVMPFAIPSVLMLVFGLLLTIKKPQKMQIYTREGLFICGAAWIIMSAFGALPLFISGTIPNYIDAFFEACSGFSTTGATVLTNIEVQPKSILLWRSFMHWIGGMGILSFMIAVLPKGEGHSMHVMKAEVPGPKAGKVVSKIQNSARILYLIYIFLTVSEILILFFCTKMRLYDAVATSLSTAGTGGFSVLNNSILGYSSARVEWIVVVFMFLFGMNFNLYYLMLVRKFKLVFKDEELWAYVLMNVACVALVTIDILPIYGSFSESLRNAAFNVNAIMSTTGFCTVDFNTWHTFSKCILVGVMFVGGCAGSTGGGIKVSRIVLYFKQTLAQIRKTLRPRSISKIRMNKNVVDE